MVIFGTSLAALGLAGSLVQSPVAVLVPSQFGWSGMTTIIDNKTHCLGFWHHLQPLLPPLQNANRQVRQFYTDHNRLAALCEKGLFGKAAIQYHSLEKTLKAYQPPP